MTDEMSLRDGDVAFMQGEARAWKERCERGQLEIERLRRQNDSLARRLQETEDLLKRHVSGQVVSAADPSR